MVYHESMAGRPLKFKTPEELEARGWEYIEKTGINSTITGLAIHLGTTRKTLCEYEKKPEYSNTVKRLKHQCEHYMVQRSLTERNQAAAIFLLKANYGYIETSKIETTQNHSINLGNLTQEQRDALDSELAD